MVLPDWGIRAEAVARSRWNAQPGYWGVSAGLLWERLRYRLQSGSITNWQLVGPVPARLLLSPSCLRPSDPLLARDFYQGRYSFGGRTVETGSQSPFLAEPPSAAWYAELHGFRWLRHLADANTDLAAAQARALIEDWIAGYGKRLRDPAYDLPTTASRLIAWIQHARFFLQSSEHGFYRRFMMSLSRQVRYLRNALRGYPDCIDTLHSLIALSVASLAIPTPERRQQRIARLLEYQLRRQILPDGAHVSRNPAHLPELLADLLPLAQCYVAASRPVPSELVRAIDRMFPRLRAMRHRDGHLAMFHGAGYDKTDLIAAVLRLDQTEGKSGPQAVQSGYYRLEAGDTVIIADTGTIPSGIDGANCHASALAFEMSTPRGRIVTNLGVDRLLRPDYGPVARATAAHSTVSIGDVSSARFRRFAGAPPGHDWRAVAGPRRVEVSDWQSDGMTGFSAEHDGYQRGFGLVHERGIAIRPDGGRVDGYDLLRTPSDRKSSAVAAQLRFHLHPGVKVGATQAANTFILTLEGDERWAFRAIGASAAIEESLYLAAVAGPVRTAQIAIAIDWPQTERVSWRFERLSD